MERIRVLLVDEDLDWIEGLIYFLEKQPDIYIVGKTLSGWEVVQLAAQLDPNVVLMSILLSNHLESLKFTLEISRHGRAKVIMLMTSLEKDEIVVNAFKAGAVDYVVKTHLEEIPDVIRAAHQNRSPIRPCVAEKIRQELCRLSELERLYKINQLKSMITPTERAILELIYNGYSQSKIASKMVISIRTVKVHVGNILKKFGVKSSKDAALKAREMGLF